MADQASRDEAVRTVLGESINATIAELSRADGKAGILLGWVGAAVALITTAAGSHHFTKLSAVLVWTSDVLLAAAVVLLLAAVRPNLRTGIGWTRYARLDTAGILLEAESTCGPEAAAERAGDMARIAYSKYLRLRRAVDLLYIAGVFLIAGLLVSQ